MIDAGTVESRGVALLDWQPEELAAWQMPEIVPSRVWIERNVRIPAEDAALPGPIDLALTPYLRGVWDALDDAEKRRACELVIERAELARDGDDVMLRLKLHYLPERVLRLPNYNKRGEEHGAAALTPRELAYLKHRRDGRSNHDVAGLFDTQVQSVVQLRANIVTRLEVANVGEAIELAADRIDAELHALPLEGRVRVRHQNQRGFTWTEKRKQILRGLAGRVPGQQLAAAMEIAPGTADVIEAAAWWRAPSPGGRSAGTVRGSRYVPADCTMPLRLMMNAPSIVENSLIVLRTAGSRICRSFSV